MLVALARMRFEEAVLRACPLRIDQDPTSPPMARIGIVFGMLLCALSAFGMAGTAIKSPIQFIPLMLGIPILFLGVVALNPHRRRHSIYAAAGVGLVGAVSGSIRSLMWAMAWMADEPTNFYSWKLVVAMTVLCAIFFIICVIGFVRNPPRNDWFTTSPVSPDDASVVELAGKKSGATDSSSGDVISSIDAAPSSDRR